MREWWQARSPREQLILLGGALAMLTLVLYVGLWEPLQRGLDSARAQVTQLRDDLRWMQAAAARLQGSALPVQSITPTTGAGVAPGAGSPTESLASQIDQSARQAQLSKYVQRIDAREQEDVQVVFEAVPFDDLVRWLGTLAQHYAVDLEQLSVDTARQPGLVNARIVLRRQAVERA